MPASIHVSKDQLKVLAELDEDIIINEQHLIADALDCWVLDSSSHGKEHRSVVIEEDGTVISDTVISDHL